MLCYLIKHFLSPTHSTITKLKNHTTENLKQYLYIIQVYVNVMQIIHFEISLTRFAKAKKVNKQQFAASDDQKIKLFNHDTSENSVEA